MNASKNKIKKGQMEIVGLLVVVVLIIIIIFFSLAFRTKTKDTGTQISFQDTKLASQLGTVISETTVECGIQRRLMRDLIIDCASSKQIRCGGIQSSCEKVNETIKLILEHTLVNDLDYSLQITSLDSQDLITNFTTQLCITTRNAQSFITPIGSTAGSTRIMIRLCS